MPQYISFHKLFELTS